MVRPPIVVCCLGVALGLAACLSTPAPTSGGDGGVSGDGGTGPGPCGTRADYGDMTFPDEVAIEVELRELLVADVNNDGIDDLLATNAYPKNPADMGVFVLLGPYTHPDTMAYHAFIPTNVHPHAIAVKDVVGNECKDITVFGEDKTADTGYVEVYEYIGAPAMYKAVPLRKDVQFNPRGAYEPVMVTYGDFSGEGHGNDLALANLQKLIVMPTGSDFAAALPTATTTTVGPDGGNTGWSSINGVFARKSLANGATSDDLVVIENVDLTWLQNDGAGTFSNPITESSNGLFNTRAVIPIDFDGKPPLDFFGGGGANFGVYTIEQTGTSLTVKALGWNGTSGVYNEMNALLVADLGGGPQPEVIMLENDEDMTRPSLAILVDSVFQDTVELQPQTVTPYVFPSAEITPSLGVIARFDTLPGPELWVLEPGGVMTCVQRKVGAAGLEPCYIP